MTRVRRLHVSPLQQYVTGSIFYCFFISLSRRFFRLFFPPFCCPFLFILAASFTRAAWNIARAPSGQAEINFVASRSDRARRVNHLFGRRHSFFFHPLKTEHVARIKWLLHWVLPGHGLRVLRAGGKDGWFAGAFPAGCDRIKCPESGGFRIRIRNLLPFH